MSFWTNFRQAWIWTHRNWLWILMYWSLAVAGGSVLALPLWRSLDHHFGNRPAGAELYPGPRFLYIVEWFRHMEREPTWEIFSSLFLVGIGIGWLAHLLISSGWIVMHGLRGFRRHPVGSALLLGARVLGRQLKAFPLWLVGWGLLIGSVGFGTTRWIRFLIQTHRDGLIPSSLIMSGLVLGGLILFAGYHWDLTRICAMEPGRTTTAAVRALRRMARRAMTGVGLLGIYTLIPVAAVTVLAGVHQFWMANHPVSAVWLGWGTYAVGLWIRMWNRLAYYAHISCTFLEASALVETFQEKWASAKEMARPEGLEPPTW